MKTASRQYKNAMAKTLRNHSYAVVTFGNNDVTAITDGTWSGSGTIWSDFRTVDYNYSYPDTIATLEFNRWSLDGSQVILANSNYNSGFVGNTLSAADGTISKSITKTFTEPHTFAGVTLLFDSKTDEYPKEVTITYYDSNNSVVATDTVNPSATNTAVTLPGTGVMKVVIAYSEMLPYRRPRLETITWGVGMVYTNDEISNLTLSHDIDPLSRRLPQEKFSFTILDYAHLYDPDNPQGIYAYINRNAPLTVQFGYELDDGTTEWLKADSYSLENAPTFKDNTVTFSGQGLLSTLTGTYYKGVAGTSSLYNLAVAVLNDANLTPTPLGNDPWDIDVSLQSMYTTAALPIATHKECLQLIAHAACCRLYTDDDNIIHIKPFGVTPTGIFDGTYTDNGHTFYSEWDTVPSGSQKDYTDATMEFNRWCLDGSFVIPEASYKGGYVSNIVSDANGDSTATFTKTFDVAHDLPIIELTFGNDGEYPLSVTATYYNSNGTTIGTETVTPTSNPFTISSNSITNCKSVKIAITSMLPYRRARISQVSFRETDFDITPNTMKENSFSVSKIEKIRNVNVHEYSYTVASSATELARIQTSERTIHVEYPLATDISIQMVQGLMLSQDIYGQAADFEFSGNTNEIIISGKTITENSTMHTITVNATGEDDTETNPLITNSTTAFALANHVADYLNLRTTYDTEYRGNPELEVNDIISLQTTYQNIVYAMVLTDSISYNGSLSGTVKLKGLVT